MTVTQYIGARYVPVFADPGEWNNTRSYEPLTIVMHEGNSYTSKQYVPKGIQITNETFWAETGNYNAQVEAYRREVLNVQEQVDQNTTTIEELAKNPGYYNAKEYCVKGNGTDNDYQAIQDLLTQVNASGGGTIYFPKGDYLTDTTIYIPSNITIIGDGKLTRFITETSTVWKMSKMGVVLCVVGSNVKLCNIGGSYDDPRRPFSNLQANFGLIGISAYEYESAIRFSTTQNMPASEINHAIYKNITVDGLYTDVSYPIQSEPPAASDASLTGIIYKNIVTPYGCVSIQENDAAYLDDIVIENIECAYLRIYANNDARKRIMVSDVVTNMIRCIRKNVMYNNVVVDYPAGNPVEQWINSTTPFQSNSLVYTIGSFINNMLIDAHGHEINGLYAAYTYQSDPYPCRINNLVIKGVESDEHCTAIIRSTSTEFNTLVTNADFTDNESLGTFIQAHSSNTRYDKIASLANVYQAMQTFDDNVKSGILVSLSKNTHGFLHQFAGSGGHIEDTTTFVENGIVHVNAILGLPAGTVPDNLTNDEILASLALGSVSYLLPKTDVYFPFQAIVSNDGTTYLPAIGIAKINPDGDILMHRCFPNNRIRTIVLCCEYNPDNATIEKIDAIPAG